MNILMNILRKIAPLLSIAGIIFIFAGFAFAYTENSFNALIRNVILIGGLLLVVSLFSLNFKKVLWNLRLSKNVPLFSLIVLLVAILIGANYSARIYNIRLDFTNAKQHTLSSSTLGIISNLKQEVEITTFHVGIPPKYLEDLMNEYQRLSKGYITTEIVDPLEQLGYASQFGNVITGNEKKTIVQSNKERVDIEFKKEPLGEELLTNAVLKVTREKRKIYFLVGHGEYGIDDEGVQGFSTLNQTLKYNNCETKTLLLGAKKEIPEDCDVLIIAGPKNPISKDEQKMIQDYLVKGGDALFLIETAPIGTPENPLNEEDKKKNPALNSILNKWGIIIGDDVVVDLENHVGQDAGIPATKNYPPHRQIVSNLDYTFYIRPRSISFTENLQENIKVAPLVLTSSIENSWAETNKSLHIKFDKGEDTAGPIPLAAVIWEPKNENKESDTRIIVFTDADFISNNFIAQYSNADIAVNSVGWLSQLEDLVAIAKKDIEVPRLDLTSKQKRIIVVVLFAMPLLIAVLGCLVWWRRSISQ